MYVEDHLVATSARNLRPVLVISCSVALEELLNFPTNFFADEMAFENDEDPLRLRQMFK